MSEVKLTVYCLTYNHENYIRQTLESFLGQKTKYKFKVIVHDDASTDNTQRIIKEYAERYPDIIKPILQTENQFSKGVDVVKRFVLPNIEGDYIATCEGDDYWIEESKIDKQVDFLEMHSEYSACVHNSVFYNMKSGEKKPFNSNVTREQDMHLENVIDGVTWVFHTSSVMYRKKIIFQKYDFLDSMNSVGDYPKAILMALNGKIRYFPQQMSVYRFASTSTSWTSKNTGRFSIQNRISNEENEVEMLQRLLDEKPEFEKTVRPAIDRKEFDICVLCGDLKKIYKDKNLRKLYKETAFKKKINIIGHVVLSRIPELHKMTLKSCLKMTNKSE